MIAVIRGPYSHRRRHTLRRHTAGPDPARASARDQLMLNHLHRHRRQVDHLPPLHTHLHGARQIRTTPRAQTRLMPPPLVRVIDQRQRRPRMTGLPTRLATAPAPQRLRSRLANGESDAGGFDEFRLFCPNCRLNSATSAPNNSICSACHPTSAASSSYDGRRSAGTTP
jgi:hypothetical protein